MAHDGDFVFGNLAPQNFHDPVYREPVFAHVGDKGILVIAGFLALYIVQFLLKNRLAPVL